MKELAPRTSSLNRAASSSSRNHHHFFSNPTSPLAFEIPTVHEALEEYEFPNAAFLSSMMHHIVKSVTTLNEHRRIYCSAEYPFSFSGQEIMVNQIYDILTRGTYILYLGYCAFIFATWINRLHLHRIRNKLHSIRT